MRRAESLTLSSLVAALVLASAVACGSDGAVATSGLPRPAPAPASSTTAPPASSPCEATAAGCSAAPDTTPAPVPPPPLRIRFLGVGGFLVEAGDDAVLSAPLFTRPSMIAASTGIPTTSNAALVASRLPASALANVRAVLSGHAHYDHLLDVPAVMALAPSATLYANVSARNVLAAYAPDRAARCNGAAAPPSTLARSRVIAVDDPAASTVDYTNCPEKRPPGAPLQGTWVKVPGAHLRLLAVCSDHPDQIGPIHYGAGDVTEEQCTPPTNMNDWREGHTVAYVVDFLDPTTDAPIYRVFYQDAPADSPVGHVPAAFLADKRVDVALMCVGTYDHVDDASPAKALVALTPRYALGGHWEDFFGSLDSPPQPIPFLDVTGWADKARAALPSAAHLPQMLQNGKPTVDRARLPQPGDTFEIAALPPD
jgi:L-ascorbate metabolism protein UlaG (beta-lactamase superfamily)